MAISTLAAASSSSPTATHQYNYDVFISFRGKDTRNGFISHLYDALCRNHINTFIDKSIPKGGGVWDELVEAIRNSKLFLVIFSENYASSTWCLRELVEIMECKKKNENNNVIVIPVFYKIEPTHVRYQTGSYSTAFGEHERSSDGCHVQQWRTALTEAANVEGFHCVQHRDDEAKLISEIVNAILPHSVNIKYYMDGRNIPFICNRNYTHLESLLMRRNLDEVLVIGIWGMGGIGKSTIAETLFNKYSSKYEGSCFLTNSRELGTPCLNNICNVLLSQLLNQDLHITNIGVLDSRIVSKLRQKRVFVVMDDVVDSSIATDLVPFLRTHLSSGSIVLLTTRDRSVLTSGGVQQIHQIQKMSYGDSHKLVSHYAFSASHPKGGYDELTDQVIDYTDGIPLALKILGSFLRGKSTSEWDSALKKLRKYPNKKIQLVLRLSYDGLDDEEKNILLDIACFFWGCKIDFVMEMLNSCEFSANIGIKNLLDKALISTTQDDYIEMHGLIQTMCRQIVHEEASRCGGQQTRIWDTEELCNILENKRRIQKVESIIVDMNQVSAEQRRIILNALRKMSKLRLLKIGDKIMQPQLSKTDNLILLSKHFKFPDKLRYLYWENNPYSSLSLLCWPQKLVKLSMRQNKIQRLWDGTQNVNLPCLESIDLTGCDHLIECPNVDGSPNLKYIILDSCTSLPDLHPSIFSLSKIEELNVYYCKALKRLCSDYCSPSLSRLHAFGCSNLEEFSVPIVPHHGSKIVLDLSLTALSEVSPTILRLKNVDSFGFNISYSLEKLPSNFATGIHLWDLEKREDDTCIILSRILPTPAFLSLKRLYFEKCKGLTKLPDNIDVLQSLQLLWVVECPIISLPERIKNLRQLIELCIFDCVKLQYLPPLPSSVEIIQTVNCESLETISSITSKLPLRKHGVIFGIFNSMNLDKHAYEAVLKDLKSRMVLGVMDEYSNDGHDGNLCYLIPFKGNMPIDCCPYYFYETSPVIVEVPPNYWISSGLVFYLHFSQYQSCFLSFKYLTFRCECYLKTSYDEWESIASSCNNDEQLFFGVLPFQMKSDHMALWYDAKCCNTIKKAIKERKSGITCNPILKFEFYAQTEDNVELVTDGRGIRWMHLDFVEDEGKSIQHEMKFVEQPYLMELAMLQRWSKPPSRWMKLNVNWSIDPQNSRGGCGGVIRDDHGFWIRGFTAPIVVNDNNKILGELIAIKMGLQLAWSMQVPRLLCESDCHEALILCMNPKSDKMILHQNPASTTALSVLYDIYELLQRQWIVLFFRLRANENSDANDMAAKAAKDEALGVFVWDLPPPELSHLLKRSSCSDIPEGLMENSDPRGTEDGELRRVIAAYVVKSQMSSYGIKSEFDDLSWILLNKNRKTLGWRTENVVPSTSSSGEEFENQEKGFFDCYAKFGVVCYLFPVKGSNIYDLFDVHSTGAYLSSVELPRDSNFLGFVFIIVLSKEEWRYIEEHTTCFNLSDLICFGCKCYLETSWGDKVHTESISLQRPRDQFYHHVLVNSDHALLWYDEKCCTEIMETIRGRKDINDENGSTCNYNANLTLEFFARVVNKEEVVIKECSIHWVYQNVDEEGRRGCNSKGSSDQRPDLCKPFILERWTKPPRRWMKMNVNWSIDPQNSRGGCGGVIRDDHGFWIREFTAPIAVTENNNILDELIAIKTGLQLAWSMQVPRLICESDCYDAFDFV